MSLVKISRHLSKQVAALGFAAPVHTVYNPLAYARAPHEAYLRRYGAGPKEVVLVGMNPGPFGMAQTGVPFGDVSMVRDWMKIEGGVKKPNPEHPKRQVRGFECPRSEISGSRLWGFAKERFETPERFFERFFVVNYCPLCFMADTGKNLTPDKLPRTEQQALFDVCDAALARTLAVLDPEWVVGVGSFAKRRVDGVVSGKRPRTGSILHPSPASPKANRGWARYAAAELTELGIRI